MSNFTILSALESIGNRVQEVVNTTSTTAQQVGEYLVSPISLYLEELPYFLWEKAQGFRNPVEGNAYLKEDSCGAVIALMPFFKEANGSISVPPSIQAAKQGNKGKGKVSVGEGGFLNPDFAIQFGFYQADDQQVVMPEHVLQAYKDKSQTRGKVLLSFAVDNSTNEQWETELSTLVSEVSKDFPSGAFTVLVISEVLKVVENAKGHTYPWTYQCGKFRLSAKSLVVNAIEGGRKPINNENSLAFLKAQMGSQPKPVVFTPVAAPAPTLKTKEVVVTVPDTEYADDAYGAPCSEQDLQELNKQSLELI